MSVSVDHRHSNVMMHITLSQDAVAIAETVRVWMRTVTSRHNMRSCVINTSRLPVRIHSRFSLILLPEERNESSRVSGDHAPCYIDKVLGCMRVN